MGYYFVWLFKFLLLLFTLRPGNCFSRFYAFTRDINGINSQKMYYTHLTHLKSPGHNPMVGMKELSLCVRSHSHVNHVCPFSPPSVHTSCVLHLISIEMVFTDSAV